jgi:Histidine kinase
VWQQDENTFWDIQKRYLLIHKKGLPTEKVSIDKFITRKIYCFIAYGNKVWMGTDRGMLIYEPAKNMQRIDTIAQLKIGEVFDFVKDKNQVLWIATDVGLFSFANGVFTAISNGNTYASNYCKKLLLDEDDNLWLATWDGLVRIKDNKREPFTTGLSSKVINDIAYNAVEKEFYVGTDNGLSVFPKAALYATNDLPKVFIEGYYIADGMHQPLANNQKLSSNNNNIIFNLSTPYYEGIEDIAFEYKLDNNDWVITKDPKINLNKLSKSKHILQVRSSLLGIGKYSPIQQFSFTIETPFYSTWWFLLFAIVGSQVLLFYLINRHNKKDKEKKIDALRTLNEQASLKQQAFTSLLNPHFIFNSLNSIQHFINKQDRINANRYLSDFATLIRRNFDAAQKQFIPLENEIENLRLYLQLEQMRFNDKVSYTITLDDAVEPDDWMLPTLILQPFVENALIHGIIPLLQHGKLDIRFSLAPNNDGKEALLISIADNGIGMANSSLLNKDKKHQSRGMQLIKERLQILSKVTNTPITLHIYDQFANNPKQPGTVVALSYPLAVYDAYMKINQSFQKKDN